MYYHDANTGVFGGESPKTKKQTNFDRIKAMSVEEMACWIHGIDHYVDDSETMVNLGNETLDDNVSDIMDWLQQEVED